MVLGPTIKLDLTDDFDGGSGNPAASVRYRVDEDDHSDSKVGMDEGEEGQQNKRILRRSARKNVAANETKAAAAAAEQDNNSVVVRRRRAGEKVQLDVATDEGCEAALAVTCCREAIVDVHEVFKNAELQKAMSELKLVLPNGGRIDPSEMRHHLETAVGILEKQLSAKCRSSLRPDELESVRRILPKVQGRLAEVSQIEQRLSEGVDLEEELDGLQRLMAKKCNVSCRPPSGLAQQLGCM